MSKLTQEQKQALVDQVLAIPSARKFAEKTQFSFFSDGSRVYGEAEINTVRNTVIRGKKDGSIVNEERENIKVAAIVAEKTGKFTRPGMFELKGELTGEMLNFLGEAYFDHPSVPDSFAVDMEVLLGLAILYKYDVDFAKYQMDISVVGQGRDAGEWVVGFTFRPIPKNIAHAQKLQ